MLLSDMSHKSGPEDPFKINRVQKPGVKDVSKKVTSINHTDNNSLTGVIALQKDRKMQVAWSEANSKFLCKERLFDGIIERAKALEANDVRRENETDLFHKQKKRGVTEDKNKTQAEKQQNKSHMSTTKTNT
jgi:hypothetical protein